MRASIHGRRTKAFEAPHDQSRGPKIRGNRAVFPRFDPSALLDDWCDRIAPCPWSAHAGISPWGAHLAAWGEQGDFSDAATKSRPAAKSPLYTPAERARRDASPWTLVQGILAPIQFFVFAVSLALVIRFLLTGQGYEVATASILLKTAALYTIMITGSIWEKAVFGQWLFARAFFWEDVFSFLVLGLQTAYVAALLTGWGTPAQQMLIAVAAYAVYVINASQFLLKLRAARLEGASVPSIQPRAAVTELGRPA